MSTLTPAAATDLFRREPDGYLDVGEGEVAHRRVGNGPDVLFVHGWPVSGATFRLLLPHLVDHVTCHVVDLPGTGWSRFDVDRTDLSIANHIRSVRRAVDLLGLDSVAVVGHDSGGMIARHAMAGDPRVRAMGLIDTEQLRLGWRFRAFLASTRAPGFGSVFGWVVGQRRLRRNQLVLGKAFEDRRLLDGDFDELFLEPIHTDARRRRAAIRLVDSFERSHIDQLGALHAKIDAPVKLVWGEEDAFFPVEWAREMLGSFPDASLDVIPAAGLFSHEERPAEVAAALLPTLRG